MAEEDIYRNKAAFERLKNNLDSLLQIPAMQTEGRKGRRKYYVKNAANLKYFERLFRIFEARDLSYIRRNRLIDACRLICYACSKDLKDCEREDIDDIVSFMHSNYKSVGSKQDFIKHIKLLWKWLFPERDEKGRPDDAIVPYPVRHLTGKIDRSKEQSKHDRLSLEDFNRLVNYFGNDVRLQAYLTLAMESLGRPQEILYCRLANVDKFDNYAIIHVRTHGKEGTKDLICIDSFPYLIRWLEQHPLKSDNNAFLFINTGDRGKVKQMRPENLNKHIRAALKHLGINKQVTCYSLKRNGVTIRRIRGDSDVQIQRIAGWSSTRQLKTYDKSNIDDVLRLELVKRGLAKPTKDEEHLLPQVKQCLVCGSRAAPTDINCSKCLRPLDREKLQQQEDNRFKAQIEAMEKKLAEKQDAEELIMGFMKAKEIQRLFKTVYKLQRQIKCMQKV